MRCGGVPAKRLFARPHTSRRRDPHILPSDLARGRASPFLPSAVPRLHRLTHTPKQHQLNVNPHLQLDYPLLPWLLTSYATMPLHCTTPFQRPSRLLPPRASSVDIDAPLSTITGLE